MAKVFINPGHGGTDPGAVGNGLREKDIVLTIGKKIVQLLKDYDVDVKLFRSNDTFYSLDTIVKEANNWKANLFISIHVNAGGGTGFESYIYNGSVSSKTRTYQNNIHAEIMKQISNVRDRGKKKANFAVLRGTNMPAILTENLFIDTKADADKLKDSKFIDAIARGHANGIVKALGLKKKKAKPTSTQKPTQKTTGKTTFYRVVAGSYNDRANAEAQLNRLKKDGYDAFIDIYQK